jgi:hypothetical protein
MTALAALPLHATVVCPAWCRITQGEHLRELHWEGKAIHWSDERCGEGWEVRHAVSTYADGSPTGDQPRVYVTTTKGLTRAGAEALALTLLAAYEQAGD